ncbi:hypothetical protein C8Q76DRAFT_713085 [Earliella scabrosa]|nr:hypothetical protein C8Q76DRAFT_713085 [Earliella scabrosa]
MLWGRTGGAQIRADVCLVLMHGIAFGCFWARVRATDHRMPVIVVSTMICMAEHLGRPGPYAYVALSAHIMDEPRPNAEGYGGTLACILEHSGPTAVPRY